MLQREGTLAKSRFEYDQLLHTLLEPVVLHVQGVIVWANPVGVQFFEAQGVEALVGKPILDLVHPDYRDTVRERFRQLEKGQSTVPIEEKFYTLEGTVRDVEVMGIPITFHGKPAVLIIFRDITEKKQQQVAIHNSERRLRTLIDSMPDQICFIDSDRRWIEANRSLLHSVGLAPDVFRGKSTTELAELCNPQFKDAFITNSLYSDEVFETETNFSVEHFEANNRYVAYEITRVPVRVEDGSCVGLVVVARDVSDQRLATKRLLESEQRYRSLFENDGDLIVSVDVHGWILAANPRCQATLGYTSEELVGKPYEDLIAPEYLEEVRARFPLVLAGEPQNHFLEILHQNGRRVEVYEKKVPIIIDNQVSGFFWMIKDITEQRVAEELLIKSERLSAVGQMAAGIAHEIKNPLTALKGFVQLMQPSENTSHMPTSFYLAVMRDELNRIESIINELLIFAKPAEPRLQPCNCATLVQEVLDLLSPEALLRNIEISVSGLIAPVNMSCDKSRLKQVLVNLIKNAMEAMPEGGNINIDICTAIDNRSISISVQDDGTGISQEQLTRIGEPFYTTKGTGTGLGLMVSRKIIENHHGTLDIQSEVGKGSRVTVRLPL